MPDRDEHQTVADLRVELADLETSEAPWLEVYSAYTDIVDRAMAGKHRIVMHNLEAEKERIGGSGGRR